MAFFDLVPSGVHCPISLLAQTACDPAVIRLLADFLPAESNPGSLAMDLAIHVSSQTAVPDVRLESRIGGKLPRLT